MLIKSLVFSKTVIPCFLSHYLRIVFFIYLYSNKVSYLIYTLPNYFLKHMRMLNVIASGRAKSHDNINQMMTIKVKLFLY